MEKQAEDKQRWVHMLLLLDKYRVLIIFLALILVASLLSDAFFTASNLLNVFRQVSIVAIVSVGMTLVILTAGIDLSVGSVMAFTGAVAAGVITAGVAFPIAILICMAIGVLMGAVNGLIVAKGAVPAFIATLAVMVIARGMTLVYTQGNPIVISDPGFRFIGGGSVFGIPFPIILMLLIFIIMYWVLKHTTFGRYIYAIGGNEEAARLAGISVNKVKVAVYALAGLFASISALIYTSRLMSAQPNAGMGIELDAIAAVIIGGTRLTGGKGGVTGTIIGALIMGVLDNILNLMNVSPFYQDIAKGIVILVAVLVDSKLAKLKK
ncbi:ribose ABC transporter permease [Alkalihalophilus lindianensis]|uniref:Ribose ABC transporter permease n=1 Tax=Alkalihalophilus lindianensis TaxID=1630542 RepID=A0ABU3XAW3_9BACI|nr:ribose ABC transporter permease [Alkalihalophilus lindianensis]MDV2684438.1 ribose ABC transporter permease [Alkalihalophilus lindianensis]